MGTVRYEVSLDGVLAEGARGDEPGVTLTVAGTTVLAGDLSQAALSALLERLSDLDA